MSLQEPGSFVKSSHLLLLFRLLLVHDLLKSQSLSLLLDTLGPLFSDLLQVVLLILQSIHVVVSFLIFLAHLSIVRVKSIRVLLVCTFELAEQVLLSKTVLLLDSLKLCNKVVKSSLQVSHALLVGKLSRLFLFNTLVVQFGLSVVLLGLELVLRLFEVFNLHASVFFVLLALLGELLQLLFLRLELVAEVFHSLARQLNLLLHADVVLEGGAKLGEPKADHLLKDSIVPVNLTV